MLKRWKQLSSKIVFQNPWWTYKLDQFQIDGGITGEYNYVHTNGACMIIPVTDNGKIIMVNQYRYLCNRESVEFPCGGVKQGMSYEAMAHLELEEETGFSSTNLSPVAEFNPYNGVTDEICTVFVARDLVKTASVPDATEEFELLYYTPDEIDTCIGKKMIWDGMTLAAWMLVRKIIER